MEKEKIFSDARPKLYITRLLPLSWCFRALQAAGRQQEELRLKQKATVF